MLRSVRLGVSVLSALVWAGVASAGDHASTGVSGPAPGLLVSGTIVSPSTRIALVVILNGQGEPMGERRVHEGETIDGYSVAAIREDRVIFERDGGTFTMRVGNDREPGPTIDVVVPFQRNREISGRFVPPPDNVEEVRKQADTITERLRRSPAFQKGLEDLDRQLRGPSESRPANP